MRKASTIFYLLAGICSCAIAILLLIFAIFGFKGSFKYVPDGWDVNNATGFYVCLLIWAIAHMALSFVGFYGFRITKLATSKKWFHILSIVLGAINGAFLLLAGIFGLVATNVESAKKE